MTRQFHARIRRRPTPKVRVLGPYALSFKCFHLEQIDGEYEAVELIDTRNTMRALVFER